MKVSVCLTITKDQDFIYVFLMQLELLLSHVLGNAGSS